MKVIILAAGTGSRLYPYTKDRPKCLVEVNGVSLLERQLTIFSLANVHDIIVVGGYLADMIKPKVPILRENARYRETNMVWTLFCAVEDLNGDCIISYGDIVYSKKILLSLLECDDDISVTIDMDWKAYWCARCENPIDDAETLRLDSDGYIIELGQQPNTLEEIEGQYMGLMKFSAAGVRALKIVFNDACKVGFIGGKKVEQAYMTDLLQLMIDSGYKIKAVPIRDKWVEIDTAEDLTNKVTIDRISIIDSE